LCRDNQKNGLCSFLFAPVALLREQTAASPVVVVDYFRISGRLLKPFASAKL